MSSGLHSTPTSFSPSFIVSGCFLSDLRSPWGGVESQWSWDLHFSVGEVEQFFFFGMFVGSLYFIFRELSFIISFMDWVG